MRQGSSAWLLVLALAASAPADRVVLNDGRSFEGNVTESEGKVIIEHAFGTISFASSEVLAVQRGPTAAQQLEMQLSFIDRGDADAVMELAVWARDNDLPRESGELLQEVLELDPDHARARKLMGHVRADGKWHNVPAALLLAQGKLEAGKYEVLLTELLPAIEAVATEAKQQRQIKHVEAHALLRSKQFAKAEKAFELLATKSTSADAIRYGAVAEILKTHPDGMYVLSESYPPLAMLLDSPGPVVEAGPASLARPDVLSAALRDHAKAAIKDGRAAMDEAGKLELTEPEAAKSKYALAQKKLDAADAIVPNIARSYRVEIARRRIAMITKGMNVEAGKFDTLKAELGKRDLTPAVYRDRVVRMLRALNRVRSDLEAVLKLAAPFGPELILEITDATHRLQRVDALREILLQELHGNR